MGTTRRGLAISTDDGEVIAAVDDFTDRLVSLGLGVADVLRRSDEQPEVAMFALGSAMLGLYDQTADGAALSAAHLARAAAVEGAMTAGEQALLAAMRHWAAGEHLAAVERFEALTLDQPTDVLSLKALEFLYYVLGQQHMGARFEAHVERIAPANAGDADVLAVRSFAAELAGRPDRAEELALEALDARRHTAWAHHTLAHVYITRGDPPAAVEQLGSYRSVWDTSSRVVACHNLWHLAVAFLDRLDLARVDELFEQDIWGVAPDSPGEQIDAVSLLWRVEMAGGEVAASRWSDVADHVEARVSECVFPFLSAHHGFALARAGRSEALDELRQTVARRVAADDEEAVRVWRPIGLPVVEASIAHGAGDLAAAADRFDAAATTFTAVGGSDAQDDLFRYAHLTALLGAGRTADARRWFDAMTAFKVRSPLDDQFAARF